MTFKIDASRLIGALEDKIGECPDIATDAVDRMSKTAIHNVQDVLSSGSPLKLKTGHLRDSVERTYFSPGAVALARVAPTAIYSRIQELGGEDKPFTEHAHRLIEIPPRPYFAPTIEASMDLFRQDAIDAIMPLFWE